MDHRDHVNLLRGGIPRPGGVWADLGSGEGAFTLALRDLIGPQGEIWSVDKDGGRLQTQRRLFQDRFPDSQVHFIQADFSRPLSLPPLDGMVMANSLHFIRNKEPVLRQAGGYLKREGHFVLVEYDADSGNPWVPYPLSFERFCTLAQAAGLTEPQLLLTVPSRFLRQIYSAVAEPSAGPGS